MRTFGSGIARTLGMVIVLALSCSVWAAAQGAAASGEHDQQIQADVAHALRNGKFKDVQVAVSNGIVTLTGTVNVYSVKRDAENRAHHRKNVRGVEDLITVVGPHVDDETLRSKLAEKLVYDRVGYGTTAFNAFTLSVQDGVVTLGGVAYGPVDKDSAVSLVSNYPGVRDVVDKIKVAPLSPADDRIRMEEARAIYGAPQLNRYAMDPAKPIRITVENGNVTLTGMVDNEGDKQVANIKANGVPGVFKVVNLLQVAGGSKREK